MAGEGLLRSSRPTLRFDAAKGGGGWVAISGRWQRLTLYVCAARPESERERETTDERTNERKVEGELAKLVQRV